MYFLVSDFSQFIHNIKTGFELMLDFNSIYLIVVSTVQNTNCSELDFFLISDDPDVSIYFFFFFPLLMR